MEGERERRGKEIKPRRRRADMMSERGRGRWSSSSITYFTHLPPKM